MYIHEFFFFWIIWEEVVYIRPFYSLILQCIFPKNRDISLILRGKTDLATSICSFLESWTFTARSNLKASSSPPLHTGKPRIGKWVSQGHIANIWEEILSSGSFLSTSHLGSSGPNHSIDFINEETMAQRGFMICLRSHRKLLAWIP